MQRSCSACQNARGRTAVGNRATLLGLAGLLLLELRGDDGGVGDERGHLRQRVSIADRNRGPMLRTNPCNLCISCAAASTGTAREALTRSLPDGFKFVQAW